METGVIFASSQRKSCQNFADVWIGVWLICYSVAESWDLRPLSLGRLILLLLKFIKSEKPIAYCENSYYNWQSKRSIQ